MGSASSSSRASSRAPSRVGSLSTISSPHTPKDSPNKDQSSSKEQNPNEIMDLKKEKRRDEAPKDGESPEGKDVMISYSHADKVMMQKVRGKSE